jgi:carboxylesterase
MNRIIPTAEPFLLLGEPSKPACLLIHGFTGTPKEMRWMGDFLNQRGYTCLGVRLAGHATRPQDMVRARWTDWTASVEDGYHLLQGVSQDIFLIGLSMGGILSLFMSTVLKVKGVVAMSTPHRLPVDYPLWTMRLMSAFLKYRPKGSAEPGSGWFDPMAWRDHISYPQNPVRSGVELKLLILAMRNALPDVTVPVLLIHSKDDAYVVSENMEAIYEGLHNASDKTKLAISGSGHVLPRDAARQQVFQSTLEFLQRIESSKESN